jgi:hypothetical protein
MGYAADTPVLWPAPPNWANAVRETLAFLTDVMQAPTGGQQVRALRNAPRRSFSFQAVMANDARRIVDAIRFDVGARQLLCPIYPDVQFLTSPLASGAVSVPCRTAGFDFVAGGQAVLWAGINAWELVTIDTIAADAITLTAATAQAWGVGTRLYPVRKARLQNVPRVASHSGAVGTVSVQLLIDEPCDWPAAWPSEATYRGVPVLEWRNNEATEPSDQYDRISSAADEDVGPVFYTDLPGMPFRSQSQLFTLMGRDAHTAFRSLVYALNGRVGQVWVPSWTADAALVAAVTDTATQIQVPWMGYTQFGYLQANRRDLRIELYDGTVLYRRVTGSAESGANEVLQLDSALGVAIAPGDVRQINWLTLCALATDTVQLDHATDAEGVAQSTLTWQGLKSDV